MNSSTKGSITQAAVLFRLLAKGWNVLTPMGDALRYDIAIERDGKFFRVQCKTARVLNGCVNFNTCSINLYGGGRELGGKRQDYRGQAEYFGVYCAEINKAYLVPVSDVGKSTCSLRIQRKEKPHKLIKYADEYEI